MHKDIFNSIYSDDLKQGHKKFDILLQSVCNKAGSNKIVDTVFLKALTEKRFILLTDLQSDFKKKFDLIKKVDSIYASDYQKKEVFCVQLKNNSKDSDSKQIQGNIRILENRISFYTKKIEEGDFQKIIDMDQQKNLLHPGT